MTVTARALVAMSAAAVLTVFTPTLFGALLLTLVVAAAMADAWAVRLPPDVTRHAPPLLSRGVPSRMSVVASRPRTRIRQGVGTPGLVVEPAEARDTLAAALVAFRRGAHRLTPVATLRIGPLGLGGWHHLVGSSHDITVYPDMPAAARLATEVRLGIFREEGRRARGPLGLGTELETIREYLPDDDIRQVNWRATARVGHPMSNTYRLEQDRDVICLVDCGRLMASPVRTADGRSLTRLDAAVDAVAAMAAVADELGDRIGAVAFGDRVLRQSPPRRDGGSTVVDLVHDLEPLTVDSDYEAAVTAVAGRKRAFVLILTDLLEPTAARPLLSSMSTLSRHHTLAVASLRDPAVDEALATPSTDVTELTRTVVAAGVSLRRQEVAAELRHRGAVVVDAPVGRLSSGCVGAYVSAKRLARL